MTNKEIGLQALNDKLSTACKEIYGDFVDPSCEYDVLENGTFELLKEGITVDRLLDVCDVELDWYIPSAFSIEFILFIRLCLGEEPENSNPKAHYFFIDCIFQQPNVEPYFVIRGYDYYELNNRIAILSTREFSKSTLMAYMSLYIAYHGHIPGFGKIYYMIYVGDSMDNNVKTTMKTIRKVFLESPYLKSKFEDWTLNTDSVEFIRKPTTKREIEKYNAHVNTGGNPKEVPGIMKRTFTLKGVGAKAISINSLLYTDTGYISMNDAKVGDRIYGADGKLCTILEKSETFYKDMYKITLKDKRELKVSIDHINSIVYKTKKNGIAQYNEIDITTDELLKLRMFYKRNRNNTVHNEPVMFIKNTKPVEYTEKNFTIDPYTLGLILGDGTIRKDKKSVRLSGSKEDLEFYKKEIPYESGTILIDKRTKDIGEMSIIGIGKYLYDMGLNVNSHEKFIPFCYLRGSIEQRLYLLQGLIDTDGTIADKNRGARFTSVSKRLIDGVADIVRSLGGTVTYSKITRAKMSNYDVHRIYIKLNMEVARLPRKRNKLSFSQNDSMVSILSIEKIDTEPSQCIAIDSSDHQYITDNYFRTHNTGARGSRDGLARPDGAVFDDLVPSESDAASEPTLKSIESTIKSDILPGLNNNKNFALLIGTPYSKKDPVYSRIEKKSWLPVMFPRGIVVKNKKAFPIMDDATPGSFKSVWDDRHGFKNCMRDFKAAMRDKNAGDGSSVRSILQEHYLRISSDEDRMISDSMIQWYNRTDIERRIGSYNLYMTTDFTTTGSSGSDMSGIAIWAMGPNSDIFMLDLCLRRQELDQQYEEVFRMNNYWSRLNNRGITAGIETDGQQKGHIFSLKNEMIRRNEWFTIGKQKGAKSGSEGILSRLEKGNKHWRFRMMLPLFQNKKIWFPRELEETPDMRELMDQIKYATYTGFGTKCDDGADLISQLGMMDIIFPIGSMYDNDDEDEYSAAEDDYDDYGKKPKRAPGSYYRVDKKNKSESMYSLYN